MSHKAVTAGVLFALMAGARGEEFSIQTPAGPITIEVSHVGPAGDLVAPPAPAPLTLRPPSIFSAPLPTGSGARSLGMAGAFTALADDATAASWNPAGLVQLERPEASIVYRFTTTRTDNQSDTDDFVTGSDRANEDGLNYFSLAYPFHIGAIGRNAVVALNRQEAYDFSQRFHAGASQLNPGRLSLNSSERFKATQVDEVRDEVFDVTVTSHLTTQVDSGLNQTLESRLLSELEFEQEGAISALTPAFAIEVTPTLSLGAAFNWYQNDDLAAEAIRSRTTARYTGTGAGRSSVQTERTTAGYYTYSGTVTIPPGTIPFPQTIPIRGSGLISPFADAASSAQQTSLLQDGVYEERNEYSGLDGYNATFGALWTLNRLVSVGAAIDLPWTASARQTRTVKNTVTTYDASHTRILDVTGTENTESGDVEFDFPLFWNLGTIFRWTPQFYTTLDAGQTRWSEFAFQAGDAPAVNPLDGRPHDESSLDDTWSVRAGAEYLILLDTMEIPLRTGLARDERPALDEPDVFYTATCGTGIAFGAANARTILDVAYGYTWADAVRGIVPSQPGLTSDVGEHQIYLSIIQHF